MGSWVVHGAAVGKHIFLVSGLFRFVSGTQGGWNSSIHVGRRNGRKSIVHSFFDKIAVHTPGTTWGVGLCMARRSAAVGETFFM
jgi:hypothetical protein